MSERLRGVPAEFLYDYGGLCWWCGSKADSREHKFKKADMVRIHGRGPYRGDVLLAKDGNLVPIQGPNSQELKFPSNLCQRCNNARSQPFDLAYDRWSEYVLDHLDRLHRAAKLDMESALGSDWPLQVQDLSRYFMKHVGCRLARDGVKVPGDLIDYMNGSAILPKSLRSGFGIRTDLLRYYKRGRADGDLFAGPGMRPSMCSYSPSKKRVTEMESGLILGYVEFWYFIRESGDFSDLSTVDSFPLGRMVNLSKFGVDGPFARLFAGK